MTREKGAAECLAIARWENEGGPAIALEVEMGPFRDCELHVKQKQEVIMSSLALEREKTKNEIGEIQQSRGPVYQAYRTLWLGFIAAPVLAGLDKFFNLLTNWEQYLAPIAGRLIPISPAAFMRVVGVVEIAAGILVAVKPRIGAPVVAAWLLGIIVNLLLIPGYFDVALRGFGLLLGAFALARLSVVYDK